MVSESNGSADEHDMTLSPESGALLRFDWQATALFSVTAVLGVVSDGSLRVVSVLVALVLFAIGCLVFLMAFAEALRRSRYDAIGIGGLYFLAGTAPQKVRRSFRLALLVQVVVAFVTASIRIYSGLAFGLLVPMLGLGLMGLWGARYGNFGPRVDPDATT
ncbi:MAG: hypothetical protein IH940_02265 [Acidobacteria bacterium]|nr:hypothetical protein [Acidobacteriota bacterium]